VTQNLIHLNDLNQQLECQYLRYTDDMPMATHSHLLTSLLPTEEPEQHQLKSTTTNGHDENSELDSISFNDEHRDEIDDLQQQEDGQVENYDQLLTDIIETLTNRSKRIHLFIIIYIHIFQI
jgi:hypothetical protein